MGAQRESFVESSLENTASKLPNLTPEKPERFLLFSPQPATFSRHELAH